MRVLVTGSSGFIGTALCGQLATQGHHVVRLVRSSGGADGVRADRVSADRVSTVHWDPAAGELDRGLLEREGPLEGVVNLAGAGLGDRRWSVARKQLLFASRIGATRLLASVIGTLDPQPSVLVSSSAVGYYGDRGEEELTEESDPGSGFLAALCRGWEAATGPAVEVGIRTVLLRSGIVLSARGGALARQLPLFRLGLGGRLGRGEQFRSWITLDDEVKAILHCLGDAGLRGPVNATAPEPATDAELAGALGDALARPAVLAVPTAALRLVLGREMADEMLLSGQRVLPEALSGRGFRFSHPDLDEALGWAVADRR